MLGWVRSWRGRGTVEVHFYRSANTSNLISRCGTEQFPAVDPLSLLRTCLYTERSALFHHPQLSRRNSWVPSQSRGRIIDNTTLVLSLVCAQFSPFSRPSLADPLRCRHRPSRHISTSLHRKFEAGTILPPRAITIPGAIHHAFSVCSSQGELRS